MVSMCIKFWKKSSRAQPGATSRADITELHIDTTGGLDMKCKVTMLNLGDEVSKSYGRPVLGMFTNGKSSSSRSKIDLQAGLPGDRVATVTCIPKKRNCKAGRNYNYNEIFMYVKEGAFISKHMDPSKSCWIPCAPSGLTLDNQGYYLLLLGPNLYFDVTDAK